MTPARALLASLLLLVTAHAHQRVEQEECSVGVAAGRATADGRPLLWKNRDSPARDNVVRRFDDGRFPYVALCNAGARHNVWGGANAAGFCIMNSLSRDLGGGSSTGPGNGRFMKRALQRCASVEDFAALLAETDDSGRRTRANFGVIDADGGAAFFETGHRSHVRFDAADTDSGILLRTNFATTAGGDGGRERFARAQAICRELPERARFDHRFLLQDFSRDLTPPPSAVAGAADTQDVRETIHRQTTVAALVFHGVRADEPPCWTTMWAVLGQPLFAVAVPVWPAADGVSPLLSGRGNRPRSLLCDASIRLQTGFYSEPGDILDGASPAAADDTGGIRWLHTAELAALAAERQACENDILRATRARLAEWRRLTPAAGDAAPDAALRDALRTCHDTQARRALEAVLALGDTHRPRDLVRIVGRVRSAGDDLGRWTLTIAERRFRLDDDRFDVTVPRASDYTLQIEADGHRPATRAFGRDDLELDTLRVPAIELQPRRDAAPDGARPRGHSDPIRKCTEFATGAPRVAARGRRQPESRLWPDAPLRGTGVGSGILSRASWLWRSWLRQSWRHPKVDAAASPLVPA